MRILVILESPRDLVCTLLFSLNIYFMYNINIFEHIQDMCLLHYNIIQWDSEESQQTYEVRLPFFANIYNM